jgi:hypothetical protein
MSGSSYTVKQLRATFTLNGSNAVFAQSGANVLTVSGLRMSAVIKGSGFPSFPEATLRVWGMAQQDMNALAVVVVNSGKTGFLPNTMLIEANSGQGWSAAFAGNILTAGADYSSVPDVCLVATSQTKSYDLANPATPSSFPVATDVFDIISIIAAKMGITAINNGVSLSTARPYYAPYASADQLRAVCAAYNIDPVFSSDGFTVTVSPKGQADTSLPFTLTPTSGLVGYPQAQGNGFIAVRSVYNPTFHVKSPITIADSDVVVDPTLPSTLNSKANGNWVVTSITNTLEALKPDGLWFSDMVMYPPNAPAQPLP